MTIKCDKCNGDGFILDENGEAHDCDKCYSCGYLEVETNEEWLRQASTEELAEFIRQQRDDWSDGWYSDCHRFEEIIEWLKEIHTE